MREQGNGDIKANGFEEKYFMQFYQLNGSVNFRHVNIEVGIIICNNLRSFSKSE